MKGELIRPAGFDNIGDKNVMPIMGGFSSFPRDTRVEEGIAPDFISDEHFKQLAECGLNVVGGYTNFEWEPELVLKSLDLAHKCGLQYRVWDSWFMESYLSGQTLTKEAVEKRIEAYCHHPAYCGIQILDEPTSEIYMNNPKKNISNFGDLIHVLRELDVFNVQCILPLYDYHIDGMKDVYRAYVREYCETFKPEMLRYDHYPFNDKGPQLERFFWNMSVIREFAKEYDIPFSVAIQAGGQWNDHQAHFDSIPYYPNEGQFYWNVNMCLAMGTKCIGYFPVVQPFHFAWAKSKKYDFERNGFFGHDGRKNPWYYYAQNINKQIAAIDEVLMNSVNEGMIVNGEQAEKDVRTTSCVIEEKAYRELVEVTGNTLIGCFDFEGKTALYVVNYEMEAAQKIGLRFKEPCNVYIIQNAESRFDIAETIELDMTPGDGILIVVE